MCNVESNWDDGDSRSKKYERGRQDTIFLSERAKCFSKLPNKRIRDRETEILTNEHKVKAREKQEKQRKAASFGLFQFLTFYICFNCKLNFQFLESFIF